ncbi:ATP-binding protein [Desulfallas sp. Bu1-1]|uniref:IS21-like element helper ATPase IstB n=1 Tax=Desulfallas sp. Bu1-1 TaxID=2787620 RepID=UPI00189C7739|nr:IS21-like element helper ATPase IstB [Desulfallas sp. Bu1-1]MBF7084703.1 ATP-binding protein [Desulfallas sp. Bu1-1]
MSRLSLKEQCKTLKLGYIPSIYLEITCHDREQYLTDLFAAELEARWANRVRHLIKRAGFPAHKTLDGFDWKPVTLPTNTTIGDLTELTFIERRENVLALGAVGTGKTHLAVALGIRACMEGRSVRFYRCLDLINALLESHRQGRLQRLMAELEKVELIIIDELGFVPLLREGAELLFNVVAQAYERRSIIVTSNLQFGQWNTVLGDNRLTAALIDRLVHHAHILAFEGESYRLQRALSAIVINQSEE